MLWVSFQKDRWALPPGLRALPRGLLFSEGMQSWILGPYPKCALVLSGVTLCNSVYDVLQFYYNMLYEFILFYVMLRYSRDTEGPLGIYLTTVTMTCGSEGQRWNGSRQHMNGSMKALRSSPAKLISLRAFAVDPTPKVA